MTDQELKKTFEEIKAKIVQDCAKDEKSYVDKDFPAEMESLINKVNKPEEGEQDDIACEWEEIEWKRPKDLEDLKPKEDG